MSHSTRSRKSVAWLALAGLAAVSLLASSSASWAQPGDYGRDHQQQQKKKQHPQGQRPAPVQVQGQGQGRSQSQQPPQSRSAPGAHPQPAPQSHGAPGAYSQQAPSRNVERERVQPRYTEQHREYYYRRPPYPHLRPGVAVPVLPPGYHTIHTPNRVYYLYGSYFYERATRGFVVVRPPIGVVFLSLPVGYISVSIAGSSYFFSGGVYFQTAPSGYVVVAPPYPVVVTTTFVVVQASALNVRLGPGTGYGIVGVVPGGVQLAVYGHAPNWYYVRMPNGTFGWVMISFTVPFDQPQG